MKKYLLLIFTLTLSFCFSSDCKTSKRFSDKVVVVTGASKGIGKGIAKVFANEGAHVVLVARGSEALSTAANELENSEGTILPLIGDVSSESSLQKVIDTTIATFGRIDVLCHNAGIYPHMDLENIQKDFWNHVLKVNLTGTFLAVSKCLPIMKKQGHGKIVITSSISGPKTGIPGQAAYTASKAGISGFIKTAAIELAKYNIQINAIEPGNIMTEGLQELGDDYLNSTIKAIPAHRFGKPEDIGYAALFLASDEASFITGQNLVVDGGQTLPESHFLEY